MAGSPKGEGSVYPSPDGRGWIASVEVPRDGSGRRIRRKRRARNKTEARRFLRQMKAEIAQYGDLGDANRRVGAAVGDYLQQRKAKNLAPRTYDKDQRAGAMIVAGLGDLRIAKLSVPDCDRFFEAAAAGEFGRPLATEQLRRLRRQLIRVIANDQRRGLVTRNVAELAEIPEQSPTLKPRRPARALTYEELGRLLDASTGVLEVLVDLSGRNGLRPAEARGLRWSRVNLERRTIRVDAQMNRQNQVVQPKTKRSLRTLLIDARSADLLEAWRTAQRQTRDRRGPYWVGNEDDLVATSDVGTALYQRNVHRSLVQASADAELEPHVSAYDLRHTAITLQVEKGHPVDKIADWAGTSERMIWEVYRHKLQEVSELGPI